MKFSITIPTFKKRFLHEAIQSVIDQTYQDWELIIVDDCSPEDIKSVVNPFLSDTRIRYYRNEKNCGAANVVDNWNICLSYCTGDYVICIGDDDRLLPCCLDEYKSLIEEYPNLNVFHAWTQIINAEGDVINLQEPRPKWESAISLIWNRWAYRKNQYIGDFCYKLQFLKAKGGYYKLPLAWGSDDITAVMAAQENGIANTQHFCFQYRDNELTITCSHKHANHKLEASLKEYEWFSHFFEIQANRQLSETDKVYMQTIETQRQDYFRREFGKDCIDGIKGNPFKLPKYYRNLKSMNYPKSIFIKWYFSSLYHCLFK